MNYSESIEYLDETGRKYGISMGLDTITRLLEMSGNPQDGQRIIHVSGTNGKGSVSTFLAHILSEAGYKTGRYLSPAVMGYREKIQYLSSGKVTYISEVEVAKYITNIAEISDEMIRTGLHHPTPFEIETAMAFMAFKDWECDFVIVECGMGGRDDATNAVKDKEMCVFTTIALDHTTFLGRNINEIAGNKAGILREHVPAVSSIQCEEAACALNQYANKYSTAIEYTDQYKLLSCDINGSEFIYRGVNWHIPLIGTYQPANTVTAITAIKKLIKCKRVDKISDSVIQRGLDNAKWPRRFEIVDKEPVVIVDGAHNPNGIKALANSIDILFSHDRYRRIGIMGVFADKDVKGMLELLIGKFDELHTVTAPSPRAMPAVKLAEYINNISGINAVIHADQKAAEVVKHLKYSLNEEMKNKTVIVVFGSLSLTKL